MDRRIGNESCAIQRAGLLAAVEQAADGIVITDPDGRIQYVNPAFTAMTGYSRDEAAGRYPRLLKSGRQAAIFYEEMWRTIRSGRVWHGELINRRKDGTYYHEEMRITPVLGPKGEIANYIAIKHDISARLEAADAQRFLAAIVQNSEDGIVAWTPQGTILTWNRGAETVLGYSAAEAVGKHVSMCVPSDRQRRLEQLTDRVLEGNPVSQYQGVCLRKNGQRFPVSVTACPIRGSGGEVVAVAAIVRDTSERYAAQETRALLASIVEFSDDAIHSVKLDGTIVSWNKGAERLFGYTSEEMVGKSAAILAPPGRKGEAAGFLDAIRKGHAVTGFHTVLQQKNGGGKDVLLSISPIRNAAGEVVGASGIAHDITKRVLAERKLRESEERFREIFERAPYGMMVAGLDGNILQVNEPFCRMVGYSEPELLAKTWMELTHPDDLRPSLQLKAEFVENPRALPEAEKRYLHRNGAVVWVRIKLSVVRDSGGNPAYYLVHIADITERKRSDEALRASEERFRQLAENIREVFFVCETEPPKLIYVSPAYEDIWGRPREEVYDRPDAWIDAIHPDDREAATGLFAASLRGARMDREYRVAQPDGSVRWIRIQTFPVFNDEGTPHRVVGMAEDITVRRRLETELNQARKLEAVGGLAAGIAHEINTPIQFVGDNVRFLQDSFDGLQTLLRKYQELLEAAASQNVDRRILEEARQATEAADLAYRREEIPKALRHSLGGLAQVAEIVKAMREFAHPGRTEKVAVDLNKALTNTLLVARNELKYVADVETELSDLPPVCCHAGDMNQVFLNLLVNAAHAIEEAAREGGPKGKILVQTKYEGGAVRIAISDTGCGIPEEIRERIFDPFFTTKEVGRGTGQGLSIARSIVADKHGGTLTFESTVGRGSTFLICLPVSDPQALGSGW